MLQDWRDVLKQCCAELEEYKTSFIRGSKRFIVCEIYNLNNLKLFSLSKRRRTFVRVFRISAAGLTSLTRETGVRFSAVPLLPVCWSVTSITEILVFMLRRMAE